MASAGQTLTSADSFMKFWRTEPRRDRDDSSSSTTISIPSGKELSSTLVGQYRISEDARGGFSCCDWSRCHNQSIGYLIASSYLFDDIHIFMQYRVTKDAGLLASAGSKGIKIWKVEGEVVYLLDPSATAVKRGPPVKRGKKSTIGKDATKRMEPCGFA
ncbi:hypothetical protein PAHAL_6G093400 [Panicum hallii]|uniref:Uncharacterized protein n=1 Tax=Panicum hallii TaxID=206008 RepID=A0A2S3I1H1_9POAL|nr:hypothetical protein PAHAL_6G093400 [Panicum hallii]